MNGRRGAAGAVAAVLGILFTLLSASPAAAAPAGSFDTPGQGAKVTTSAVKIAGTFTADGGRLEGNVVLEVAGQRFEKPVTSDEHEPFDWTVTIAKNGSYEAVATVMYRDWPYQLNAPYRHEMRRQFVVEAPPAPVKGITTKVNETERTVAVKWAANTEPDLLGYVVSRSYNKGAYTDLKFVEGDTTTYADVLTDDNPAGSYRYQVRAIREDANPDDTNVLVGDPGTSAATPVKTAPASGATTPTTAGSGGSIAAQPGAAGRPATPLQSGKIDTAKFNNLLGEASLGAAPKDTAPLLPRAEEPVEEDGGYSDRLPYGPDGIPGTEDDGEGSMSLVEEPATSSNERPTTLLSLAGAALAAMLVAITRWVLNEVKRSEEELAPVEPAVSAAVLADLVDFEPPAEIVVEETPAPALPRRARPLRSPMRPPRDGAVAHELVGTTSE